MVDLFCGLGGWAEGGLSVGYRVVGYDIEAHQYGELKYPGELIIQDVLTLHGSQFKDATLIVASPPCQEYSYMAMPWIKAKAIEADYKSGKRDVKKLTALFDACFRIQREASEAAGHPIPMVVENVRGAQKWVGKAKWNFGSYYLWGDVPALMPITQKRGTKLPENNSPRRWDECEVQRLCDATGHKTQGMNWSDKTKRGQDFTRIAGEQAGLKVPAESGRRTDVGKGARFTSRDCGDEGVEQGGDWFNDRTPGSHAMLSSKSNARKAASAMIAKIPFPLAQWIAKCYLPR